VKRQHEQLIKTQQGEMFRSKWASLWGEDKDEGVDGWLGGLFS